MGGVRKELGRPKRLGSFKKGEGGERVVLKDFSGGGNGSILFRLREYDVCFALLRNRI